MNRHVLIRSNNMVRFLIEMNVETHRNWRVKLKLWGKIIFLQQQSFLCTDTRLEILWLTSVSTNNSNGTYQSELARFGYNRINSKSKYPQWKIKMVELAFILSLAICFHPLLVWLPIQILRLFAQCSVGFYYLQRFIFILVLIFWLTQV